MGDAKAFAALEKREWSEPTVPSAYASGFAKASDMVVPHLVTAVDAGPDTDALDLCCGHGNVSAGLLAAGARVTGLDFSEAMLELAREALPEARFVSGDAMQLPFSEASFDAVTIGFGMPHVPEPPRVLAETRRILRPGGRIAFSTWCGPEVDGAFGYVFGAIGTHGSPDIALPPGSGANDYADPEIAYPVLEKAGFGEFRCEVVASCWQVDGPGLAFDFFREEKVHGVSFFWGHVPSAIETAKAAGLMVMSSVGSAAEARRAQEAGADLIVAQGHESGGHVWAKVSTMALIPAVSDAVDVPILAAGGIADGRGMAEALMLGAAGVWVGTRFLASPEADIHETYRARVIEAAETDTDCYSELYDGHWPKAPHRRLKNLTSEVWRNSGCPLPGSRPGENEVIGTRPSGAEILRHECYTPRRATGGRVNEMSMWCGQDVGSVRQIMPAAEIVAEMWDDARRCFSTRGISIE